MCPSPKVGVVADTETVPSAFRTVKRHGDGLRRFRIGVRPWLLYMFSRLFPRLSCRVKSFQDCLDLQLEADPHVGPMGKCSAKHWHSGSRPRRPFSKHCIEARLYTARDLQGSEL